MVTLKATMTTNTTKQINVAYSMALTHNQTCNVQCATGQKHACTYISTVKQAGMHVRMNVGVDTVDLYTVHLA